jgi:HK97 family phage portal protein
MKVVQRVGTLLRKAANYLSPLSAGWWWPPSIRESYTGAWQSNVTIDNQLVTANWAVFACVTLIAGDIAKMPARVMKYVPASLIWEVTKLRPVLRKPNRYQTWPDFIHSWLFSLLLTGNTYVFKERQKGITVALYVLSPNRVKPLVAQDGSVYYDLAADNLSDLQENIIVPASEIMHDRINCLWHPLVGLSPIYANGVAAMQALAIQDNSAKFFQNMSRPGGVMTAPGAISDESAERVKATFHANFSGANLGNLLVLGDGLKYEAMTISAHDSQLIEQLKFTGEMICATFHVPPYKLGLGPMPTVNNTAALNQQYYDQCLHPLVDGMERRLDEGLEISNPFAEGSSEQLEVWFDTSELLRMDPATRAAANAQKIGSGVLAPNEGRRDENLPPVEGGDVPFLQEQNWPISVLANRKLPAEAAPALPAPDEPDDEEVSEDAKMLADMIIRGLSESTHVTG